MDYAGILWIRDNFGRIKDQAGDRETVAAFDMTFEQPEVLSIIKSNSLEPRVVRVILGATVCSALFCFGAILRGHSHVMVFRA
jgi:hypothetical protein